MRILVPIDFSPSSDWARLYAATLAVRLDATIELLHVVEAPGGECDATVAEAVSRLEGWRIRTVQPGVRVATVVRVGPPAQTIPDYAAMTQADLVVMGRRGHGLARNDLMGSVAAQVLRDAPCPVLTLPDDLSTAARGWPTAASMTLRTALGRGGTSRE